MLAAIAFAACSIGALHSLAPDHWMPFLALGRAQRWSAARVARVTALCGFGHVTVSALLGVAAALFGLEVVSALGRRLASWAALLLIGFGVGYGGWGMRRALARLHGHRHAHYDHVHHAARLTPWALFLLFSADPCVAVIPLIVAAAPLGALAVAAVVAVYEIATIATMTSLVLAAWRGWGALGLRFRGLERFADAAAGGLLAALGLVLAAVGA